MTQAVQKNVLVSTEEQTKRGGSWKRSEGPSGPRPFFGARGAAPYCPPSTAASCLSAHSQHQPVHMSGPPCLRACAQPQKEGECQCQCSPAFSSPPNHATTLLQAGILMRRSAFSDRNRGMQLQSRDSKATGSGIKEGNEQGREQKARRWGEETPVVEVWENNNGDNDHITWWIPLQQLITYKFTLVQYIMLSIEHWVNIMNSQDPTFQIDFRHFIF